MKKFIYVMITIMLLLCGCTKSDVPAAPSFTPTPSPAATPEPSPTQVPAPSETPSPTPTASPTPVPLYLEGYKIGIDPGHQDHSNHDQEFVSPYYYKGKNKVSLGAKGIKSGVREYIFNLEISFLLEQALKAQGAEVFMTRLSNDVDISNKERALMVDEAGCDIWIRIHANYSDDREKTGICMLTPKQKSVGPDIYEPSKVLSGLILKHVIELTEAPDHGISYRGDITGFNWSKIPVTLIECGYLSNKNEDLLLQTEEYKLIIVEGIVQGMIDYFSGQPMPEEYGGRS